jgi:hypothetical protein
MLGIPQTARPAQTEQPDQSDPDLEPHQTDRIDQDWLTEAPGSDRVRRPVDRSGGPGVLDPRTDPPVRPRHARRPGRRPSGVWAALVAVAGLTLASYLALILIRHQGVVINGDEPHYLVVSESIGRFFTLNMSPGYSYIIAHHIIYPFVAKPGPKVAASLGNSYLSHGLYLPIRSIGVSVLLAVPVLAGLKVAEAAWSLMLAALAVGVIHLVSMVVGARSPRRFLAAGVFLCPVFVLATTQIYPDLMTGMILAIGVLLVAMLEVGRQCTRAQLVTGAVLLAVLPWLAEKNIPLTVLMVVILVVAQRRAIVSVRQFVVLAGPAAVSVVVAAGFNLWAYGKPLGIKNPVVLVGPETFTRAMALMFDRRSGILIQLPIILLGVAALWTWRRRMPLTVVAAVVVAIAAIYGNATEAFSQTGGSFSGRYQWPVVPLALALAALYLFDLWKVRRKAVPVVVGIGVVLSVIQSVPILLNEHLYYSQVPWDPSAYGGWWGGLDPSPILGYLPGAELYNVTQWNPSIGTGIPIFLPGTIPWHNARDLWGLACLLVASATVVYCLVGLARSPSKIRLRLVRTGVVATALCLVLTLSSPVQLPASVRFAARRFSTPYGKVVGTSVVAKGPVTNVTAVVGPFWELRPGQYRTAIYYSLSGANNPAGVLGQVIGYPHPPHGLGVLLHSTELSPDQGRSTQTFVVRSTQEVAVRVQYTNSGTGQIAIHQITLAKLASG